MLTGELPDMVEVDEWLSMTSSDTRAYRDAVSAGNFMAMRQAAMIGDAKSAKMDRLIRDRRGAEHNGRRGRGVLLLDVLNRVAAAMPGQVFGPLTGSVPPLKRQEMVDQFSRAGHGAVLVSQIVAGGVGLNIQAASVVVICEPQLKPTMEWQAVARARRMGQPPNRCRCTACCLRRVSISGSARSWPARPISSRTSLGSVRPLRARREAYDVSEAELAREIIAAERERLFAESA